MNAVAELERFEQELQHPPILAIDPGSEYSAYVELQGSKLQRFGKVPNAEMLQLVRESECCHCAIEMIASYGMPVGAEVFETCVWIGRFQQAWRGQDFARVFRQTVKLQICKSPKANDASIRQALLDRYGGKDRAVGRKATPGPLYGVTADVWSALAVGITYQELLCV